MKIFIKDINREAKINIYGIDNEERTEEFMKTFFTGMGLDILSADDKENYGTESDYAITKKSFEALAQQIENIQRAIDSIAKDVKKNKCDPQKIYSSEKGCFIV